MFENYNEYINILGFTSFSFSLFALIIWTVIWKGIALWKAARNTDKLWFIALLVINTVGILEILYIYFFSKKKE
jgi:methionyl-tRNA synthetase